MIQNLICFILRTFLKLRYKVEIKGIKEVLSKHKKGSLILPNHPALIDPVIILAWLYPYFRHYSLADADQVSRPVVKQVVSLFNIVPLPDTSKYGSAAISKIKEALSLCGSLLLKGENVVIYPSGSILKSKNEKIGGNSAAFNVLSAAPDARALIVKTKGLWGSSFSRADGNYPSVKNILKKGVKVLLFNFIFFIPKRKVEINIEEPADFPRGASKIELNSYLEKKYNAGATPNTYVSYFFYEKEKVKILPEPSKQKSAYDFDKLPKSVRQSVIEKIKDISGVSSLSPDMSLSKDLGLDSLSRLEIALWIEKEFGFNVPNPDVIETVADAAAAAAGGVLTDDAKLLKEIPEKWFKKHKNKIILSGETIAEMFLNKAAMNPSRAILADQLSGVKTYRDIVTGINVLKDEFKKIEGEYVGVMFPATAAASVIYLSVMFSGKIPVMINWTAGERNIKYFAELLSIKKIITSQKLIQKLQSQGADFKSVNPLFLYIEKVAEGLGLFKKLKGKFNSYFIQNLKKEKISDKAVVLFTSGSESVPKAVPLTHENIIANIKSIINTNAIKEDDSFIGFLPPFHSFGLTVTMILPLLCGIKTVYHANPTEGGTLAKLINDYKPSILCGTPTFINGIAQSASPEELLSLRVGVTGAEKCPESVYTLLQTKCPSIQILEGYGITECSPVVSVNRPENPVPFSIGKIVDCLDYVIINSETGKKCAKNEKGMLLVRGKSVFNGYLNYDGASPFVSYEGKEYYKTGDIVVEREDGVLFFKARLKRFVKLGGEMISLPAIEEVLLKRFEAKSDESEISPASASAVSETKPATPPPPPTEGPLLAVESFGENPPEIILFTTKDITREEANKAIRDAGLSALHNIRAVIKKENIPVLGTGKTDYRSLKVPG